MCANHISNVRDTVVWDTPNMNASAFSVSPHRSRTRHSNIPSTGANFLRPGWGVRWVYVSPLWRWCRDSAPPFQLHKSKKDSNAPTDRNPVKSCRYLRASAPLFLKRLQLRNPSAANSGSALLALSGLGTPVWVLCRSRYKSVCGSIMALVSVKSDVNTKNLPR